MAHYGRPLSPGGRRVGQSQPGRSSTGTLIYPSSFDPHYGPTRSSREFSTAAGPRTSADRVLQPRVVPRYRQESPPSRQPRDDYAVRPRRLTLDPDAAEIRRPLSAINPTEPNRSSRPVITTSERPSSPVTKPGRSRPEEPYYLQPASSTRREHRRNYTLDSADPARSVHGDRDRADRGGYRSSGIGGGRSGYNLNQPLVRQSNDRDRGGYEYTDPREQMYRDTEPRPRPRRDSYTGAGRERPLSMTGLEDYNMPRVERTNRDAGPPVSMRGFGGLGRSGSLRQGPASRDYDASSDFSRNDYERRKAHIPRVALHQDPEDVYSTYRDDESAYDDPRDRRPRKTAFQDEVPAPKSREAYDDQYDRVRRPKPHVDNDAVDRTNLEDIMTDPIIEMNEMRTEKEDEEKMPHESCDPKPHENAEMMSLESDEMMDTEKDETMVIGRDETRYQERSTIMPIMASIMGSHLVVLPLRQAWQQRLCDHTIVTRMVVMIETLALIYHGMRSAIASLLKSPQKVPVPAQSAEKATKKDANAAADVEKDETERSEKLEKPESWKTASDAKRPMVQLFRKSLQHAKLLHKDLKSEKSHLETLLRGNHYRANQT
ncbi:MAG: hypothetical protein Q9174_002221 [Haloplaca sp. 1 TL-2023]